MIALAGVLCVQMASAAAVFPSSGGQAAGVAWTMQAGAPDATAVTGVVRDADGRVVPGVTVTLRSASGAEQQTTSGPDGRFSMSGVSSGDLLLIVRARGFAEVRRPLVAGAARQELEVDLEAAALSEAVTVTPTRGEQRGGTVPASVSRLEREQIRQSPAVVADDLLRQLPTFSLFRRTSSLASHPTAQGVSLRGIGPSGVSRTLVLLDGVPFNDPFGGWVYWTRVPLETADRVELVDTASSSLYGNYAIGGVINIMTAPPSRRTLEVRTQYGSLNSPKFDVVASDVWGRLGIVVNASAFDTEGYATVAESERGLVDTKAAVDFRNFNVKLQYDASDRVRAFFRAGYFDENRDNGKITTIDRVREANDTTWKSFSGGANVRLLDGSEVQASLFSDVETFRSNFMAVPQATPARSIGRMTLRQTVPTTGLGGAVQWSKTLGTAHALSAGLDWRWVKGESQEEGLDATTGTNVILDRRSGGRQQSTGVFLQDVIALHTDLTLTLSARVDRWRNYDGHNLEVNMPSGNPTGNNITSLPEGDDTVVSPRVAALYRVTDRASVWGSFGTGFRAPTLNELYRQFQVGTVRTLANNQLGPERLRGGELGVRLSPARQLTLRATWFDNRMEDAVSNITTGMLGALEIRQRQNVGLTRIAGLQTDAEYGFGTFWRVTGGYLYNRATVQEFDANPGLVGNTLPQVPRHRGSVEVTYSNPRLFTLGVMVQAHGRQFDDDRNTQTIPGRTTPGLPGYGVVSLTAARALGRNLEVFAGAQNLFDQTYYVGMLPTTVGAPRMINAGLRVRIAGN